MRKIIILLFVFIFSIQISALQYTSKKCVIFFMPTDKEVYADSSLDQSLVESYSDLLWYANKVDSTLKANNLNIYHVSDTLIKITTKTKGVFTYNRKDPNNAVLGMIFFDGVDSIKVNKYVYTDIDIIHLVNEFFDLNMLKK